MRKHTARRKTVWKKTPKRMASIKYARQRLGDYVKIGKRHWKKGERK